MLGYMGFMYAIGDIMMHSGVTAVSDHIGTGHAACHQVARCILILRQQSSRALIMPHT